MLLVLPAGTSKLFIYVIMFTPCLIKVIQLDQNFKGVDLQNAPLITLLKKLAKHIRAYAGFICDKFVMSVTHTHSMVAS
jgi:hypothetical protein